MSLLTIFFHSTQTSINTTRIAKKQSHNLQISNNLTILRSAKIVQVNAEQKPNPQALDYAMTNAAYFRSSAAKIQHL